MSTITEDYVSLEVAKLLKDKGFDEPVATCYSNYNGLKPYTLINTGVYSYKNSTEHSPFWISAPTLQMVMKWIREVHDIDVSVVPLRSHKEYLPRVEGDITSHDAIPCRKYEEACEIAIKYCLENLI